MYVYIMYILNIYYIYQFYVYICVFERFTSVFDSSLLYKL